MTRDYLQSTKRLNDEIARLRACNEELREGNRRVLIANSAKSDNLEQYETRIAQLKEELEFSRSTVVRMEN